MRRLTALLVLGLTGCGYSVMGASRPFGAECIAVVPFAEMTAVGISADLAQELTEQLAAGGMRVVSSGHDADVVLSGSVDRMGIGTSPLSDAASPTLTYQVFVSVSARLDRDGKQIWSGGAAFTETFFHNGEALVVEANRREAVHRLAGRLARELHDQLVLQGQT